MEPDLMYELLKDLLMPPPETFYCLFGALGVASLVSFGHACYLYYKEVYKPVKKSKQKEQMREQSDLEKKIHKDTII